MLPRTTKRQQNQRQRQKQKRRAIHKTLTVAPRRARDAVATKQISVEMRRRVERTEPTAVLAELGTRTGARCTPIARGVALAGAAAGGVDARVRRAH